jgi:tRNA G46 methylase TrmB
VETELKQSRTGQVISESGLVSSTQAGIHPNLDACVHKHLETAWAQPLHSPTVEIYRLLDQKGMLSDCRPVILDSGCGTGKSTRRLAEMFPLHLVIGVDRSSSRLAKSGVHSGFLYTENCILVRAELATFWRLLLKSRLSPEKHCLFYPNPWPKPGHLSRRWHGHPVFPQLLELGGEIEMRCNWEVYAREFAKAAVIATGAEISVKSIEPGSGITPFEQKYLERGQPLFSVCIDAKQTQAFRLSRLDP